MDWNTEAAQLQEDLIKIRRHLHAHPELGNEEFQTTVYLEKKLHALGIETHRVTETGCVGILHGALPGKTVALRSDIDALPIPEETGYDFASKNEGVMHACGHDFHMTCLLGAAALLARHKEELHGNVVFLLEPNEECDGGAERMIQAGAIDNVDAVFGCHVNPDLPVGTVGVKYGSFYAAASTYDITIHGKSCHGAEPENGIDAMYTAALIVAKIKGFTKEYDGKRAVVSTGVFNSGYANNIVADEAFFKGMIRTEGFELRDKIMKDVRRTVYEACVLTGASADADIKYAYSGVTNHNNETKHVQDCAAELFGKENVIVLEKGTMTTEDFGYFIMDKPGSFYHLGVGSPYGLHSSGFAPDEKALVNGAALHAKVLFDYLNQ